jgi:hypothetical protein
MALSIDAEAELHCTISALEATLLRLRPFARSSSVIGRGDSQSVTVPGQSARGVFTQGVEPAVLIATGTSCLK